MLDKLKKIEKKQAFKRVASVVALVLIGFLVMHSVFGNQFNSYRWLFLFAVESLVLFFILFWKKIGKHPEFGFLAVALICGSLLSFSEPKTFISWDEGIHYKSAEKIARGFLNFKVRPKKVPYSKSLAEQTRINTQTDEQYAQVKARSVGVSLANFYNKIVYFPSSIVLVLGNLIRLPSHIVFILARWINLLVYASIVFLAIRKLKSGKMIMSVIALFPTAIFLAANYNYDSWVTAFTLLGLAYVFSELQEPEKKTTPKEAAIMIGAFVIGLGPKAIYFPLMFLLFLLSKSKFASVKEYKKFIWISAVALLFVVGSFLIPFVVGGPGKGDHRGGSAVNATAQVKFILSEPIVYTKILLNFIKDYVNPLNAGGFMIFFAYLGNISGFGIILTLLAIAVLIDKNEYDKKTANLKTRLLIVGIFLATTSLIATALYVSFTAVRSTIFAGVQPRYLIPLLFPLLFVIGSSRIKNPINKNIFNGLLFTIIAIVLLQGIWNLITKLYY